MKKSVHEAAGEFDPATVKALRSLAKRWNVSESEALRRSIHFAAEQTLVSNPSSVDRLKAFEDLQRSMKLSSSEADRWAKDVRGIRKASSVRRLGRILSS